MRRKPMIEFISNRKWELDCESICFECAGKFMLKVLHPGVALCLWCRITEWIHEVNDRLR